MVKFAKQNLVKSPLRSFLLLLGFTFMMVVLSLSFTMQDVLEHYYYYRYDRQYEHIDLEMTIGSNAAARYFSTRSLDDNYDGSYAKVFKIDTLTDDLNYLTVLATSSSDFSLLYGQNYTLTEDEIILTESSALAHDVLVSDTLTLTLGSTQKTFTVKQIVPDYGVFQGDKGFILHDPHVSLFIKSMFPGLSGFSDSFFTNFHNTVYFDTDDVSLTQQQIRSLSAYSDLDFKESRPIQYIKQLINRAVALFQLMLLFIGITVLLLIQTTYALVFREKEQILSVIKLLGGSLWFGFFIWVIELLILYIPAAIIGYALTFGIIQIGMQLLMPGLIYPLSVMPILYSLLILIVLFILTVLFHTLSWRSKSEVSRLKIKVDAQKPLWIHGGILLISLIIYLVLPKGVLHSTLIQVGLVLLITYPLLVIVYQSSLGWMKQYKESHHLYLFKMGLNKRSLYRFLLLAVATITSVTLLFETTGYIRHKADVILEEYQGDLLLSNVLSNGSSVEETLSTNPLVESSTAIGIFRSVPITEGNQVFQAVYMLDPEDIPTYFGMRAEADDLILFQQSIEPSIWLPKRYEVVYGLSKGDFVHISLNPQFEVVELTVIGFFDEAVGNTAFINLHRVPGYEALKQTHILINTSNPTQLKSELIETYSSKLYYVFDFQLSAQNLSKEVISSMNYATFVTLIVLSGLLLSLVNQGIILFFELKPSYVRASILGVSLKMFKRYFWIEGLIQSITLTLSTVIIVLLLNPLIKPLLLLFDEYENLVFKPIDMLTGLVFGNLMLVFTRLVYVRMIRDLNPSDVLKMHQIE